VTKALTMTLTAVALSLLCLGCMGRLISEGMGTARGASGKVVDIGMARDLTKYRSLRVEPISVSPGLQTPADMPAMIRTDLAAAAEKSGLKPEGEPGLKLSGEIIHYETGGTVDTAIGPLQEVVVRTKLIDVQSGNIVAEANLIGRSKATSSSGAKNLSDGVGEALHKWLKDRGLKKAGEKQKD
jgi:hypothetical protein